MEHAFEICPQCRWAHWKVEKFSDHLFLKCHNCGYETNIFFSQVQSQQDKIENVLKELPDVSHAGSDASVRDLSGSGR